MKPPLGMLAQTNKVMPMLSSVLVLIGCFGTLGVPPRLIPPHSVGKPYTNSPPSSIVTMSRNLVPTFLTTFQGSASKKKMWDTAAQNRSLLAVIRLLDIKTMLHLGKSLRGLTLKKLIQNIVKILTYIFFSYSLSLTIISLNTHILIHEHLSSSLSK